MPLPLLSDGGRLVSTSASPSRSETPASEKISERAEIEVEIALLEAELGLQFFHSLGEPHEGQPEPFDLLVVERALLHSPKRLALHQLPQQLDQGQDELRKSLLDLLRVGRDPARCDVQVALEVDGAHAASPPKL